MKLLAAEIENAGRQVLAYYHPYWTRTPLLDDHINAHIRGGATGTSKPVRAEHLPSNVLSMSKMRVFGAN